MATADAPQPSIRTMPLGRIRSCAARRAAQGPDCQCSHQLGAADRTTVVSRRIVLIAVGLISVVGLNPDSVLERSLGRRVVDGLPDA